MIHMPKRSVTRFFIPLIDVLTLLFCIFLLMPLVKATPETAEDNSPGSADGRSERPIEETTKAIEALRKKLETELEQLREAKKDVLQERVAVRVLEIDPKTGQLVYYTPERVEIRNEADAHDLIRRDRRAIGEGKRELYYEILYPREPGNPFPLKEQKQLYNEWFKDVAHGFDIPGESVSEAKP